MTASTSRAPLFSLISPIYNVERFLPEFLDSLAAQTGGLEDVELIFVIDGSPDASEELVRAWAAREHIDATIIVQENAGASAARNTGIGVATGQWLLLPDPDDVLHADYLSVVRQFLAHQGDEVNFISTRTMPFVGAVSEATDSHALGYKFRRGTRLARPDLEPKMIHLQLASALVRRSVFIELVGGFDSRIRPIFEDADVIAKLWLRGGAPVIGVLSDAVYYYRQRKDGTSQVESALTAPSRYTDVVRFGYLALLQEAANAGRVPMWLQYLVLYDLQWVFKADHGMASPTSGLPQPLRDSFLALVEDIFAHIDDTTFLEYNATSVPMQIRLAWLSMKTGSLPPKASVSLIRTDDREQLVQLRYFTEHESSRERIELDGLLTPPVYSKTRAVEYFGRTFLYERILWVSALGDIRVFVGDEPVSRPILYSVPPEPTYEATVGRIWRDRAQPPASHLEARLAIARPDPEIVPWSRPLQRLSLAVRWRLEVARDRLRRSIVRRRRASEVRRVHRSANSARARRQFAGAWVLIDRDTMARDNAESFYRYLRAEQPQVNAWFVINRDAPDYRRLRRDGFKLVAFGSRRHIVLMRHARHLISSQANGFAMNPYEQARFGRGSWKFTFLQHGVTTNDLSRWVNPKPFDLFIAATADEYHSLVDDLTQYVVTDREVALTGFPRHDELARAQRTAAASGADALLIVPTWRNYLLKPETGTGHARELVDDFWESTYIREWLGLVRDPRLKELADRAGLRIVFAAHPNLQAHMHRDLVPDHVEFVSYAETDIKAVIPRSRITLTDYSSLGLEAVYTGAPTVYFQFDRAEFFGGTHAYRAGYFSVERDGYGPVAYDRAAALDGLDRMLRDHEFAAPYLERIATAYRYRDEKNSERVFRAIQSLDVPWHQRDRSLFDGSTTEYDLPALPELHVPAETTPALAAADDGTSDGVSDLQGDLVGV